MMATPITYALRMFSTFFPPQKPLVFSGIGSAKKLADLIIASGHKRPLIIADSFLIENSMLDDLLNHFQTNRCTVTIFGESIPNPTLNEVKAGLHQSLENNCDSILAIGGGSVIDVAKVVAAASTNRRKLDKLAGILKVKHAPLPFYAIPTTSGSGSEVTNSAVISDPETHKKQFFVDPKYIPVAVGLDPEILKTLPAHMTAAVGMDALTHAIEAYTSGNNFVESERDAAIAIKLLVHYLPIAYADGDNLKAREMVAQAAFLAGFAFTKSSLGYVHAISHQVSALYNTPHGLANAIILPRVIRFNQEACAQQFADLERLLSDDINQQADNRVLVERFIARIDALSETLGIPASISELDTQDFREITKDALSEAKRSYAVPKVMKKQDVEAILRSLTGGNLNVSFVW